MRHDRRQVVCDSCGRRLPLLRARRLVWARVCATCDRALQRADAVPEDEPRSPRLVESLRPALGPLLRLTAAAVLARLCGPGVASFAGGALAAETLTWAVFGILLAPFEGVRFAAAMLVRVVALIVVQGPALPGLAEASRLDLGAVGFFIFLIVRALWFVCWWHDLLDGDEPPGLEGTLPRE